MEDWEIKYYFDFIVILLMLVLSFVVPTVIIEVIFH